MSLPNPTLVVLARSIAAQRSLDPALVCAVVEQESSWDTFAIRYEPAFRTRYVVPLALPPSRRNRPLDLLGTNAGDGSNPRASTASPQNPSLLYATPQLVLSIGCAVLP